MTTNYNLVDDDDYKSISDIHRSYPDIPYGTIYYIAHYYDVPKKPSKKIEKIMQRFEVFPVSNNKVFEKVTVSKNYSLQPCYIWKNSSKSL